MSVASYASLAGKRALVTGAGRGIGRAVATALVGAGCDRVYALCKLGQELKDLQTALGPKVETFQVDITNWPAVTKVVTEQVAHVDLLVNNAGVVELLPVGQVSQATLEHHFAVNVHAAVNLSQLCAEKMATTRTGGAIVNISSQASVLALKDHLAYCASKAALDAVTRSLALELGPLNIRINSVRPTVVLTDMAIKAGWTQQKGQAIKQRIPLNRFARPQVRP